LVLISDHALLVRYDVLSDALDLKKQWSFRERHLLISGRAEDLNKAIVPGHSLKFVKNLGRKGGKSNKSLRMVNLLKRKNSCPLLRRLRVQHNLLRLPEGGGTSWEGGTDLSL